MFDYLYVICVVLVMCHVVLVVMYHVVCVVLVVYQA